jgi:hypothetical protein
MVDELGLMYLVACEEAYRRAVVYPAAAQRAQREYDWQRLRQKHLLPPTAPP